MWSVSWKGRLTVLFANFGVDNAVDLVEEHVVQAILFPIPKDLVHVFAAFHFRRVEGNDPRGGLELEEAREHVLVFALRVG